MKPMPRSNRRSGRFLRHLYLTCEQWVSVINCHGYDAMVRRYVLQYIFPKGEGGAPDRKTIDAALPEIEHLLATLDKTYGKRNFRSATL